jgi:hypothetical protein
MRTRTEAVAQGFETLHTLPRVAHHRVPQKQRGFTGPKGPKTRSFTSQIKYGIYITYMAKPCNTRQAAKAAGIAVMTLHRWVVAKRLKAPKLCIRHGRAVRLWGEADMQRLKALKQEIYCKGRGRKKGYKRK